MRLVDALAWQVARRRGRLRRSVAGQVLVALRHAEERRVERLRVDLRDEEARLVGLGREVDDAEREEAAHGELLLPRAHRARGGLDERPSLDDARLERALRARRADLLDLPDLALAIGDAILAIGLL